MDAFRKIIGFFCMGDQRRFQEVGAKARVFVAMLVALISSKPSTSKLLSARFAPKNELKDAE